MWTTDCGLTPVTSQEIIYMKRLKINTCNKPGNHLSFSGQRSTLETSQDSISLTNLINTCSDQKILDFPIQRAFQKLTPLRVKFQNPQWSQNCQSPVEPKLSIPSGAKTSNYQSPSRVKTLILIGYSNIPE